jgi:PhoPQ-activated pathogenicity-related protein
MLKRDRPVRRRRSPGFPEQLEERVMLTPALVDLTLVRTPTAFDAGGEATGEVTLLPSNEASLHEWNTFRVEVWGSTPDGDTDGVAAASFTLLYDTNFFTATNVIFGPAFDQNQSLTIDDGLGSVAVTAQTGLTDAGDDRFTQIAVIEFASLGDDQVPIDSANRLIGPYDLGLILGNAQVELVTAGSVETSLGSAPETKVFAIPLDQDDSQRISLTDVAFLASAFGAQMATEATDVAYISDIDKSARVSLGDVAFYAANFFSSRAGGDGDSLALPPSFPESWLAADVGAELIEDTAFGSSTLTFTGGAGNGTSVDFTVEVDDDALPEGDESFAVELGNLQTSSPGNAAVGTASAGTTIVDDDISSPFVTLDVADENVDEAGGMTLITATLDAPTDHDVIVDLGFGGTAVNDTDYIVTPYLPEITLDGNFADWADVPAFFDPQNDQHDTNHDQLNDVPDIVDHPDVDLLEYKVTHDEENLYFYFRSRGEIGNTQHESQGDAGRYYVIVTIDVDENDVTGYPLHEGGYYPTTPGYDVNAEIEFYNAAFNTGDYINHGATDLASRTDAFLDQSSDQYNYQSGDETGITGPFDPGFVDVVPGSYDWYTQWVYKEDDPNNGNADSVTFVWDRGPVVQGIITGFLSADGHELEMIAPLKGFLVDELGDPIIDLGSTLDLSYSLEASGELAPGGVWGSDTGDPISGYQLADPNTAVTQIVIPAGQTSASLKLTGLDDGDAELAESIVIEITTVSGATEYGRQQDDTTLIDDDQIAFSIDGATSVTEDASDGDNNQVTYTIGYTGVLSAGEIATVDVTHDLNQTVPADYTTDVVAAINAAIPGATGVSFDGTTLTFTGGVGNSTSVAATVEIDDDAFSEGDESFVVELGNPQSTDPNGAILSTPLSAASTTVIADDESLLLSISGGASVTENSADGDNNQVTYTIGYKGPLADDETASVEVSHNLNQTETADYTVDAIAALEAAAILASGVELQHPTNDDSVTAAEPMNATAAGNVAGFTDILRLHAGFNETSPTDFVTLEMTGSTLLLDSATMQIINGGSLLPDGDHVLHLRSEDELGNYSPIKPYAFTLDRQAPELAHVCQTALTGTESRFLLEFSESLVAETISAANFSLHDPLHNNVSLLDFNLSADGRTAEVSFDPLGEGVHELVFATHGVQDPAGNRFAMGQISTVFGSFTVDNTADTVDVAPGDGAAVDSLGQKTLRAAVQEANARPGYDVIRLNAGIYTFNLAGRGEDSAATGDLDVTDDLTILGAGEDVTVIDAATLDRVLEVFPGVKLSLVGVTITGGVATDEGGSLPAGGGVLATDANLILTDSTVAGNTAEEDVDSFGGAGIAVVGGSLVMDSVTVSDNTAESDPDADSVGFGGGLFAIDDAQVSISEGEFTTNTADVGGGLFFNESQGTVFGTSILENSANFNGGGIDTEFSELSLQSAAMSANFAGLAGGALSNFGSRVEILQSNISGNSSAGVGGGIENSGIVDSSIGEMRIVESTLSQNVADSEGGAIHNFRDSRLEIQRSTLADNEAGTNGGGIANAGDASFPGGEVLVINSTLSNNMAGADGGGIWNSLNTVNVTQSTIVLGSADQGGGIANASGSFSLNNSIVAKNTATTTGADAFGTFSSAGHNLIGDGTVAVGFVDGINGDQVGSTATPVDPLLGPLGDHGGPTSTHALLPGSPAIDAGDNVNVAATDQRGFARIFDADGDGTATVDVGSFELQSFETALDRYVNTPDPAYGFTLDSTIAHADYTAYVLDMTSQEWRSADEVDQTLWQHYVTVVIPDTVTSSTAVLLIGGGSNGGSPPTTVQPEAELAALTTGAVTIYLPTVPNQALTFLDDNIPRTEDEIIAYTFDKYHSTGDDTWPVLLAMVKSAVAAMDTAQTFVPAQTAGAVTIDDFVISGASKRGWTTWLTAAVDPRVSAIAPAVMDVLNMDEQMAHHFDIYKDVTELTVQGYSIEIHDYVDFNIIGRIDAPTGQNLGKIIDPFEYRERSNFQIPKYIVNGTGDEFFVPDSSQFYLNDLPGENYLRYVPNVGHGLNAGAVQSIFDFFNAHLTGAALPEFSWSVENNGTTIRLNSATAPLEVNMWQATNPDSADFRSYTFGSNWTSSALVDQGGGEYVAQVSVPATGATAFMIEMIFDVDGTSIPFTTQVSTVRAPASLNASAAVSTGLGQSTSTGSAESPLALQQAVLAPIVSAAVARWTAAGLSPEQAELLESVSFTIADLPDQVVGQASGLTITLDVNAAGFGWFIDTTPFDDAEFSVGSDAGVLYAEDPAVAGRIDLLTTIMHELGHVLGLDDSSTTSELMHEALEPGVRKPLLESDFDTLFADEWQMADVLDSP